MRITDRGGVRCLAVVGPGGEAASFDVPVTSVRAEVLFRFAMALETPPFQAQVFQWAKECFGAAIAIDPVERLHRFTEEALELGQAIGMTRHEAMQLVDYVYGRPRGSPRQEAGGVMVTLAALCEASSADMDECAREELKRCWENIEKIRAKQRAKPKFGPLPGS